MVERELRNPPMHVQYRPIGVLSIDTSLRTNTFSSPLRRCPLMLLHYGHPPTLTKPVEAGRYCLFIDKSTTNTQHTIITTWKMERPG